MVNNTCPLRITAAAGTKLAGTSSLVNVIIFSNERSLKPKKLSILPLMLLGQAFAHCLRFLTAASRKSLGLSQSQCD